MCLVVSIAYCSYSAAICEYQMYAIISCDRKFWRCLFYACSENKIQFFFKCVLGFMNKKQFLKYRAKWSETSLDLCVYMRTAGFGCSFAQARQSKESIHASSLIWGI